MTDIGREVAQARAVLGARTAPDLRVLKAVHTGLLLLPTEHSAREWEADDDGANLTIRRRAAG